MGIFSTICVPAGRSGVPADSCCRCARIVWIALALRQFNVVTSQGQDTWTLIKMTTLALPNLMAIIAPVSFLIAALHTLNRLNTDSELIVLTASGATVWTAARPLLLLALLVSCGLGADQSFRAAVEPAPAAKITSCRCAPIC